MSGFELRPLSLGELLDRAFLLFRRNFWLFAGILAIPLCLGIPFQFSMLRSQGAPFPLGKPAPMPHFPGYIFGIMFAYWIAYTLGHAATTFAVANAYLGRPSTIRESYGKLRGHFGSLIGVTLGVGIRIIGLMLLLLTLAGVAGGILAFVLARGSGSAIPPTAILIITAFVLGGLALVLWFSVRYSVSLPAVLLENISGRAAIRRSVELSRGRRGQIFVAILLSVVVTYAVVLLFQGPFYAMIAVMGLKEHLPTWLIVCMSISSSVGGAIAGPLLMIILVLCYYDLRIRKEGFDLQHMMSSLPEPTAADPAIIPGTMPG